MTKRMERAVAALNGLSIQELRAISQYIDPLILTVICSKPEE